MQVEFRTKVGQAAVVAPELSWFVASYASGKG